MFATGHGGAVDTAGVHEPQRPVDVVGHLGVALTGGGGGHELAVPRVDLAQVAPEWWRRQIIYLPQEPSFFAGTVRENILLPCQLNRITDGVSRVEALLDQVGLAHRANAFPEALSGGEQQRVAVARALVTRPAVVLADEPTGNLDAANSTAVSGLLFDAARAQGTTLIVATHSNGVAEQADRRLHLAGSQ